MMMPVLCRRLLRAAEAEGAAGDAAVEDDADGEGAGDDGGAAEGNNGAGEVAVAASATDDGAAGDAVAGAHGAGPCALALPASCQTQATGCTLTAG